MDIVNENEVCKKQYFQLSGKIWDKLKISHNSNNIVLWNKYQLFLYENLDFNATPIVLMMDFVILQLQLSKKHLLCLDYSGNIHVALIKLKDTERITKLSFQLQMSNVVSFLTILDYLITLEFRIGKYTLYLRKLLNFEIIKTIEILKINVIPNLTMDEIRNISPLIKCYMLSEYDSESMANIFKLGQSDISKNSYLIIITLDRRKVFACLMNVNSPDEDVKLSTLYTAPSFITNIEITRNENVYLLIGLKTGTLIVLPLGNLEIQTIHLNTSIQNIICVKEDILYSDGLTLWELENIFSKSDNMYKQLFIQQPADFIQYKDYIIYVTYSNAIYIIHLDFDNCYITNKTNSEYYAVKEVFKSTEGLLNEIKIEIEKNDKTTERINLEENYTSAIALAYRKDVMNQVLIYSIFVYDHYDEVTKGEYGLILTNEIQDYFESNTILVLITLELILEFRHKFFEVLNSLLGLIKLNITFRSKDNFHKTTSISIKKLFDKLNYLIPINCSIDLSDIYVEIDLVCRIPDPLDKNENVWIVLSKKQTTLYSEQFIRTINDRFRQKVIHLREENADVSTLLLKTAENHHSLLIDLRNLTSTDIVKEITYYIKLPDNYETIIKDGNAYKSLNRLKSQFLLNKLSTNEFLKLNQIVHLQFKTAKVKLQIVNEDFYGFLFKIFGRDTRKVFNIRNYFAKLLYDTNDCNTYCIPQVQYTSLEVCLIIILLF